MARIHQPECRGCQYQEVSVKSRSKGFSTTWLRNVGRGILQPLQAGPCPYKQEDIGGALVVQVVLINSEDQTDHIQIYPACTVWPRYSRLRYLRHGTWMEQGLGEHLSASVMRAMAPHLEAPRPSQSHRHGLTARGGLWRTENSEILFRFDGS